MLLPKGDTYETEIAGRFYFHVEITLPLIGPPVRYEGWLLPHPNTAHAQSRPIFQQTLQRALNRGVNRL
ncbi:MAG TPA: hypothetical protein DD416_07580 [Rhodobacteraceae bacterium]|jgi:hypothetical protein|nr:DUF4166 domain-containing protein [Rhodobacter sp.]HBN31072.1 hypothetical protein [Paracoccaceae bacterium]